MQLCKAGKNIGINARARIMFRRRRRHATTGPEVIHQLAIAAKAPACEIAAMAPTPSIPKAAFWMALSITSFLGMSIRGPRDDSRTQRLPGAGTALGDRLFHPFAAGADKRGFAGDAHPAPPRRHRPQPRPLRRPVGWFFALTLIPIGQVVSIEFTMPIWTAILAASFLGERITVWKILAIVLGLIGVVVIVRPGDRRDQSGPADRARRCGRISASRSP